MHRLAGTQTHNWTLFWCPPPATRTSAQSLRQSYLPVRPFTAIKKAVAGELHCSQSTQLAVALWLHQVCSPTE